MAWTALCRMRAGTWIGNGKDVKIEAEFCDAALLDQSIDLVTRVLWKLLATKNDEGGGREGRTGRGSGDSSRSH